MYKIPSIVIFIFLSFNLFAQRPPIAHKLAEEAIQLMGNGDYESAIDSLESALEIVPNDIDIVYEIAHAYYQMRSYREAILILDTLVRRNDAIELHYQLLGNSYDYIGRNDAAISVYLYGLKKFPNSARLYTELGTAYTSNEKEEGKAQLAWQKAIELNPFYDEVYYRTTRYFYKYDHYLAAMYFGELFLNTTFNEKKFIEVNKMMYDCYNKILCETCEKNIKVYNSNINLNFNKHLLYFKNIYEYAFINLFKKAKDELNMNEINELRKQFIVEMNITNTNEIYTDPLTDYWEDISKAGFFDEYNYWLLSEGNREEFLKWAKKDNNYYSFKEFVDWKTENRIDVDPKLIQKINN
jgi:tetratricopeptide (TPR) repeat protein